MVSYHHIIPRSGGFQNDEGLQKLSHTCTKCLTLCLWVEMVYKHRLGSSVSTSKMLFAMILRSGGPWRRGNDLSAPPLYVLRFDQKGQSISGQDRGLNSKRDLFTICQARHPRRQRKRVDLRRTKTISEVNCRKAPKLSRHRTASQERS